MRVTKNNQENTMQTQHHQLATPQPARTNKTEAACIYPGHVISLGKNISMGIAYDHNPATGAYTPRLKLWYNSTRIKDQHFDTNGKLNLNICARLVTLKYHQTIHGQPIKTFVQIEELD